MKCSECSNTLKPVVAFDLDGTLGDYHQRFQSFAEDYVGYPLAEGRKPYGYDEEFSDYLGLEKSLYRAAKLAYRQGGLKRSMPVFDGASELVKRCRLEGAEVWVTTTRPWARLDNIDPDTKEWLRRNNIPWDYMLFDADKYDHLAEMVNPGRVVAVLEDDPQQFDVALARNLSPIMKINHHANLASRTPGVATLGEALHEILPRIRAWRSGHVDAA